MNDSSTQVDGGHISSSNLKGTMMKIFAMALAIAALLCSANVSYAVLIVDDAVEGGGDGWTGSLIHGGFLGITPKEGSKVISFASSASEFGEKTFTDTLAAGTYTATFWMLNYSNSGFPTFTTDLRADGTPISDLLTSSTTPTPPQNNTWVQWTLVYDVPSSDPRIGETLSFRISEPAGGNGAFDSFELDFVKLTPEPSTLVLALIGFVGLGFGRRSRRRRA